VSIKREYLSILVGNMLFPPQTQWKLDLYRGTFALVSSKLSSEDDFPAKDFNSYRHPLMLFPGGFF